MIGKMLCLVGIHRWGTWTNFASRLMKSRCCQRSECLKIQRVSGAPDKAPNPGARLGILTALMIITAGLILFTGFGAPLVPDWVLIVFIVAVTACILWCLSFIRRIT